MEVVVKNIIGIFTIKNGDIYLVMDNKKIPEVICSDEINKVNNKYLEDLGLTKINLHQTYTFSKKEDDILTFYILFNDIVNYNDLAEDTKLVLLNDIEKNIYINKSIEFLKNNILKNTTMKKIYPDEFRLPEVQKLLEKILDKKFDRRNFRKKLLKEDTIISLDKISKDKGRPAKVYKFKEVIIEKVIM